MTDGIFRWELKACDNPLCERQTSAGAAYCCDGCSRAHEGRYEIHEDGILGHSAGCNERHAQRNGGAS